MTSSGCQPCYKTRCKSCYKMRKTQKVTSKSKTVFQITDELDCSTAFVVYCLTCVKCNMQYVGQTTKPFRSRLCSHRHNILYNRASEAPHVAPHFNQTGHDYECTILQKIPSGEKTKLAKAESLWISRLNTVWPNGLNEMHPSQIG